VPYPEYGISYTVVSYTADGYNWTDAFWYWGSYGSVARSLEYDGTYWYVGMGSGQPPYSPLTSESGNVYRIPAAGTIH